MTFAGIRQWRHHKAFRIDRPRWTEPQVTDLLEYFAGLETAGPDGGAGAGAGAGETIDSGPDARGVDDKYLAAAATNLWRAQRKLAQGKQEAQGKQAARYLRGCADALAAAGLTLQDHDGEPFHPGRSVEVLVYAEDPDVTTETVTETVRPAVYHHDRRIQPAQVIVAVPTETADPKDSHA